MTNTAEETHTDSFQILGLVKKKKKKRKFDRERLQPAGADFYSPLTLDHFPISSWDFNDQASEGSKTSQKKSKKKARQEKFDSPLDNSCITTGNELTSEPGIEVCKPKKKKKRKPTLNEPDNGYWLCDPLSQGNSSCQPNRDGLENGDWTGRGTPVKKKREKGFLAKHDEASKVSAGPMKNRTDSTSSDKHEEASHSNAEDWQMELSISSPGKMQHSSLSQSKAATKLVTSTEDDSPLAPRKPPKHRKSSDDVISRNPHKHKKSSGIDEESSSTDVVSGKRHKRKKSSGIDEESSSTDVISGKPHKHKKHSGMEDIGSTHVEPGKSDKHKKSFGVEESDSTKVISRNCHKYKTSSGIIEESGSTDVISRKPHKHKKPSGIDEETNSIGVISGKPHKPKKNSGMEESDSTDVISRKPHKHKKSGMEDIDSTDVAPGKPHKHQKTSGVEESDSTNVVTRKPHKHKKSGMEDTDSADVAPGNAHKHNKTSDVEESDSINVISRKPHKLKQSSGIDEESNSISVVSRKPHKSKKSSVVEESDSTEVISRKPHKHKKSLGIDVKSNSTGVISGKSHKHKKSNGVKDSDRFNVGFEVEENVKSVTHHDQIKNKSQAKHFPSEDSNVLAKIPEDVEKFSSTELPTSPSFFIDDNEFLDSSEFVLPDLETVTKELEEFIPHVRNFSASGIIQLARRDLARFKNFKKQGIAVKFGKFTRKENEQLKKNVQDFLQASGIESAEKLLFTHRFPEEKAAITRLKANHLFGVRIAEGIPRPWRLVYYRARKIFDPVHYGGSFSDEEKRKLLEYQAMYGNNWRKISALMSRSCHAVQLKYNEIKCDPNLGSWHKDETKRLLQAVEETLRVKCKLDEEADEDSILSILRQNLYKGIPWMKIEAQVGTRNWRQCRGKWSSVLTNRMSHGRPMSTGIHSLRFKISLIERLYELNIEDGEDIDWEAISTVIGDVPPYYVRNRFLLLKATQIPFWHEKTFPEIIDYLYDVTLPKLKALLKRKTAKPESIQVQEPRKMFPFHEIFPESSDELTDESEDELNAESGMNGSGKEEGQS